MALDLECLDRIYLNAYVPKLAGRRAGGEFLDPAPGQPDPLPSDLREDRDGVPEVGGPLRGGAARPGGAFHQGRPQDRADGPLPAGAGPHGGRSGDAPIGVAQEFARVFTGTRRAARAARVAPARADAGVLPPRTTRTPGTGAAVSRGSRPSTPRGAVDPAIGDLTPADQPVDLETSAQLADAAGWAEPGAVGQGRW